MTEKVHNLNLAIISMIAKPQVKEVQIGSNPELEAENEELKDKINKLEAEIERLKNVKPSQAETCLDGFDSLLGVTRAKDEAKAANLFSNAASEGDFVGSLMIAR